MGNYGNQWNFNGQKWAKPRKPTDFEWFLAGLVVQLDAGTTYSVKIIQSFPMISQVHPLEYPKTLTIKVFTQMVDN